MRKSNAKMRNKIAQRKHIVQLAETLAAQLLAEQVLKLQAEQQVEQESRPAVKRRASRKRGTSGDSAAPSISDATFAQVVTKANG